MGEMCSLLAAPESHYNKRGCSEIMGPHTQFCVRMLENMTPS